MVVFASCQKATNDVPANPSKLAIKLYSPTDGSRLRQGDTLYLKADVSYVTELHGYEIEMTDSATGATVWSADAHQHDDHFSIDQRWIDTLNRPATLRLNLSVEIDHDGNRVDTTVRILNL